MEKNVKGGGAPAPETPEQGDVSQETQQAPTNAAGETKAPDSAPVQTLSAVAPKDATARIAAATNYTAEQVEVIKNTVAKGTTNTELAFFLMQCREHGLNPFNREMWCFKDNTNKLLIFTGRDGFLVKAQKDPRYNGMRSGCIRENDEYSIDIPNGRIEHRIKGNLKTRGNIVGAYCIVFMVDRNSGRKLEDGVVFLPWENFNRPFGAWKTHPDDMITKCAESHCMKKSLGMSGLEIEEDFYVHNGVAYPYTPEAAKPSSNDPSLARLEEKATQIRLMLANYAGDDHDTIQQECAQRRATGNFTEAYADAVIERLKPRDHGVIDVVATEA